MSKVLESCNLTKKFDKKNALNNLSFGIDGNKIIGLIGRNGAGKTTFLKVCAGYLKPNSGAVNIFGEQPFNNLKVLSNLIFIDEEIQYDITLKLGEILKLGKLYYANWDEDFARRLLKYFGLKENLKYKKLSRGMKTQFNIIMGLASRAPVTLMDEPTLGLDAAVRKEFYKILLDDYMNHPRTFIISSHLLSEIENLLEEVVLIKEGSLVLHKPMDEMRDYGVFLNGRKDLLTPLLERQTVLHCEYIGNSVIAGIKNDLTPADTDFLSENHVEISRMSVQDLCIYLTGNEKDGGFDACK